MALVRMHTRPTRMFDLMNSPVRDFDRLFSEFAGPLGARTDYAADLYETDDKLVLEMAVPGLTADDLEISVEDGQLIVKGNALGTNQEGDAEVEGEPREARRYWLQTISRSEFSRSLKLPKSINVEAINAQVQDGILVLTMPKVAEAQVRKIEINKN